MILNDNEVKDLELIYLKSPVSKQCHFEDFKSAYMAIYLLLTWSKDKSGSSVFEQHP